MSNFLKLELFDLKASRNFIVAGYLLENRNRHVLIFMFFYSHECSLCRQSLTHLQGRTSHSTYFELVITFLIDVLFDYFALNVIFNLLNCYFCMLLVDVVYIHVGFIGSYSAAVFDRFHVFNIYLY